jgi:hypothetical protein
MVIKVLKYILLFVTISLAALPTYAQQDDQLPQREFIYGLNFNTNGGLIGGGVIKSSSYLQNSWFKFWALEVVEVKHPKENRRYSSSTGNSFIYGKANYLFVLRPEVGREYVFFRKAPESGVQVNGFFAAGPSIGLLAPYYIVYDYTDYSRGPNAVADYRVESYNPEIHTDFENRIRGSAAFFTGLGESKFRPGLHVRGGVNFEYGRYREDVTGVEVGFVLETFSKKMVIIPQADNSQFFPSFYLTLYYGRRK